ncbi:electron transfer flavoprotein subunit beta/FixA family protein [Arthrobacter sp. FW306-2-2C-D06B]|uniref:electron transfer flavoprotein subunit beta/FixA family protein n=1 Tax=Arthrobacter sp. FW306-2-2C-D06B TaxID=2879618 RepID=UPI001F3939BA|nr:electron transfer flavoprotein subunit beta/FixA family protein [Arthrobacter sp. FW306-2-2C-D06B]UKA60459.1 electron transfer flavoprotein subunit beta/FixA family protein [Arthrobacter sp. FW306-2-2C-D06B]
MKIVVLVKEVPDTNNDRVLNLETGLADREASERVLDEIVERAMEVALSYADHQDGTEIIGLSMASDAATATLRKALALGADRAVLVADDSLLGADLTLTAEVLAAALRRVGFDLVIAGNQSTDGSGGVLPAMLSELLDVPQATGLETVELTETTVGGERSSDWGRARVRATLPAIVSVTENLPNARFPNFKGIMASKKRPLEVLSLAQLGLEMDITAMPRSILTAIESRPPRAAGVKILDEGNAGDRLAEFLIENRLA